ncbi:MAG TPA: UDP-N-acetylmuramate dehydrogenase [Terriglobales bacterium]|jgi:UDP-N-acetylmuramate dehydrogenase|nr:UDP-N-acetylmuramate dehydrogenase [Terriglobales bacterium]
MEIQENIALAPLTTLGVGGNARYFALAVSIEDVDRAVSFAEARKLPLFVLGGGSNVLISDNGWLGLVLQIGISGIDHTHERETIRLIVGAGEDWDSLVAFCVTRNLAGIECLSGIPGSVGATPVQNVGAYGQEVSQTISSVLVFDLSKKEVREMDAADCTFGYRRSIFNTRERGRYIILRVTYELRHGGSPNLSYADLQKYFACRENPPTLGELRKAVLEIRASKGMLITPGDPDSHSAGSFFKNPVLTAAQFDELSQRAKQRNLQVPSYPALSQQKKISAAWLVENSGFKKGYVKGQAGISTKHALALVNRGNATAAEIIALRDEIHHRVEQFWGISLEPEPVMVGFLRKGGSATDSDELSPL